MSAPLDPRERNVLAIDTTSDVLTLAVLRGGAAAGSLRERSGTRIAREIFSRVDELLAAAGLAPGGLHALAVARGPGSFTGTRIGMAVALTLAQVRGIPCVGVDTLRLLAERTDPAWRGRFHALLNCAREEVYHAPYARHADGRLEALAPVALADAPTVRALVGDAPVVLERFAPAAGDLAGLAGAPRVPESAEFFDGQGLLRAALPLLDDAGGPPRVEPLYLKSEAFRTWRPHGG